MDLRPLGMLLVVALVLAIAGGIWLKRKRPVRTGLPRPRHGPPRTPRECAQCRATLPHRPQPASAPLPVRPWAEVTRRRGRPKALSTPGSAGPSPMCSYQGITDERVHAVIA
jgi:hypothetical protein